MAVSFPPPSHAAKVRSLSQVPFSKLPEKQPFPPNKRKVKHMDYIPLDCYSDGDGNADADHSVHGERITRISNASYARDRIPRLLFVDEENKKKKKKNMGLGLEEKISTEEKFQYHGKKDDPDGPTPIKKATELILSGPALNYKCLIARLRLAVRPIASVTPISIFNKSRFYFLLGVGFDLFKFMLQVEDFWKEATLLSQLHHPNVVSFCGVVTDGPPNSLAMIIEYMVNGSLKQVLQKNDRTIDRRKRVIIAMDAALGMDYLHEKNIVHFDLKSHNLLVNVRDPQRPVCKIGDFGLAKEKQNTFVSAGARGTLQWMAPELLKSNRNLVTEKVDVFSFGIVMWELLTGEAPYAGMSSDEIMVGVVTGYLRPEIPNWCDPAWRSLMTSCWSSYPQMRPSFAEIARDLRAIAASMNIQLDSFRRVEYQEARRVVQLDKKLGRDPYSRACYRCAGGQKTHANVLSNSAFRVSGGVCLNEGSSSLYREGKRAEEVSQKVPAGDM
ncbi:hypothetical protein ACLOJK_019853 [Asimina triloba]